MARMAGRTRSAWCHACHAEPGPDCPDRGMSKRQVKRAEKRQWVREVMRDA